jgi:chemotaxis response regulator CheB
LRTIKVLIANRPRLMRELVLATIADQPDIEVLGVVEDEDAIAETVERVHPDFLIIGLDRSEERPKICDLLLDRFPHMRILAMAAERNSTICYWACFEIRSHRIENSEAGVLRALRGGDGSLCPIDSSGPSSQVN